MCRLVPDGPDCTPPLSRFHSTWLIADVLSAPWTVTSTGTLVQPDCGGVVLLGTILSSWMRSSVQSVQAPLLSCARWVRTCWPLTLNVTVCPGPPDWGVPQSTIHSQPATLAPARVTTTSELCQPVGADVVSVSSVNPPAGTPGQELGTPNMAKPALAWAGRARNGSVSRHGRSQRVRNRRCTPGSSAAKAAVLDVPSEKPAKTAANLYACRQGIPRNGVESLRRFAPAGRTEGGERANRLGIELRPGAAGDLPRGGLDGPRLLVRTLVDEDVEHVGDVHEPRLDRDRLARQAVRIPAAVPALVVMARDRLRGLQQVRPAVGQHARAEHRVRLDDLELLVGQLAGLEQDRVRDRDLADVVQRRRAADPPDLAVAHPQPAREPRREMADALGVLVGVVVAIPGGGDQPIERVHARGLHLAPARHRLRGEHALELGLARPQRGALGQRAKPAGGKRPDAILGAGDRGERDHGRPRLEPERIQPRAQRGLGGTHRDDL